MWDPPAAWPSGGTYRHPLFIQPKLAPVTQLSFKKLRQLFWLSFIFNLHFLRIATLL